MKIQAIFYYHLKEKAGTGNVEIQIEENSTITDLIKILEIQFPNLRTHLNNVLIVMDGKVVLGEDKLVNEAKVVFMTPVGGG